MGPKPAEMILLILGRDEAEELCWAYAGHKPAQRQDSPTWDALNKVRLAARWPRTSREPRPDEIGVEMSRAEAEALAFDSDDDLIGPAIQRIEEAL